MWKIVLGTQWKKRPKHMKKLVKKGIQRIQCDFCEVKFLNKSNFTRHKKVNCLEQKGVIKITDSNDPLFIKPWTIFQEHLTLPNCSAFNVSIKIISLYHVNCYCLFLR